MYKKIFIAIILFFLNSHSKTIKVLIYTDLNALTTHPKPQLIEPLYDNITSENTYAIPTNEPLYNDEEPIYEEIQNHSNNNQEPIYEVIQDHSPELLLLINHESEC